MRAGLNKIEDDCVNSEEKSKETIGTCHLVSIGDIIVITLICSELSGIDFLVNINRKILIK
ncbi:hypothetical protein AB204_15150 [Xenorhabdus khoisanae]|uniref:Uncharacterized protein n=1 Tax=Xenorhabdus khoisanae TaxID=880157 RepID=A0A0J5FQ97_9GAMM|nr:hypothetical protein AB204_15150 [Xenorhabdus khoisanae]